MPCKMPPAMQGALLAVNLLLGRCLRFVEGNVFTVVSTSVVILNVVALVKEMTDEKLLWLDAFIALGSPCTCRMDLKVQRRFVLG